MLPISTSPITDFKNSFEPSTSYQLSDVRLTIPDGETGVFKATTHGPPNATAWVRAWISNEENGAFGEAEVSNIPVGSEVELIVKVPADANPELACIRIESEQFATKHTLHHTFK